jgi:FkbM family methyltransferase
VRILLVLKQRNYLRTFAGPIEELAKRGHSLCVAFQEHGEKTSMEEVAHIEGLEVRSLPSKRQDEWRWPAPLLRRAADYLRYLEPPYHGAGKLRARAFDKLLRSLSRGERPPATNGDALPDLTDRERQDVKKMLALLESVIPVDPAVAEVLRETRADVVLVSPLVDLGSGQTDYVKAARALGIASGHLLFSWDNLTTKGTFHVHPDRLFVWNERIRREAIDLHGIAPDAVVVTGAPRFDPFFEITPTLSTAEFCTPLGFDPARPTLTYLCSSKFVSPDEIEFLGRWTAAIRAGRSPLAQANLLIRPHPDVKVAEREGPVTKVRWRDDALGRAWVTRPIPGDRVAFVRTGGGRPFFECLHHAQAVVGLNTTAEIEAAIAGRPVFTILAPSDLVDGQQTTLHFHYLLAENGGFVRQARDLDEHVQQLENGLTEPADTAGIQRFVTTFVRPQGADRRVAEVIADAIEAAFGDRPAGWSPSTPVEQPTPQPAAAVVATTEAPLSTVAVLDYPRLTVKLHVTSDTERRHRVIACEKEPWTVEWLETMVGAREVLYDIGANVGAFSLIAALRGARVVAFEPGAATYAKLCDNIVLNGCEASIVPVPLALADTTSLVGFKYRSMESGQSRHSMSSASWQPWTPTRPGRYVQPMCAMTLDEARDMFELPTPQHLKLDVDGAEHRVLVGATRTIADRALRSVLVEVASELWAPVNDLLSAQSFTLDASYRRTSKGPSYALFKR